MRRTQGNPAVEAHDPTLMQHGGNLKGDIFAALLHHPSRDFQDHNSRDQRAPDIFNDGRNGRRLCAPGEIFKPCQRIN